MSEEFVSRNEFNSLKTEVQEIKIEMNENKDILQAISRKCDVITERLENTAKISDLQRELQMADLRASQIAQTQAITQNIYNELKNCPVGTVPVYGNQPIFTCPNSGCGCNGI